MLATLLNLVLILAAVVAIVDSLLGIVEKLLKLLGDKD